MFIYLNTYDVLSIACQQIERSFVLVLTADRRYTAKETYKSSSKFLSDSLKNYPKKCYDFRHLLRRFDATTYICDHTHNTSIAKINEFWQINGGHVKGIEAFFSIIRVERLSEDDQLRNQHIETYWEGTDLARTGNNSVMNTEVLN